MLSREFFFREYILKIYRAKVVEKSVHFEGNFGGVTKDKFIWKKISKKTVSQEFCWSDLSDHLCDDLITVNSQIFVSYSLGYGSISMRWCLSAVVNICQKLVFFLSWIVFLIVYLVETLDAHCKSITRQWEKIGIKNHMVVEMFVKQFNMLNSKTVSKYNQLKIAKETTS